TNGPLSDLFAFGSMSFNVSVDGTAEVASGQAVSGNYYAALGLLPRAGRLINDQDDQPRAPPLAVLSYPYWQRRFGGDPQTPGRQINVNNVAFTVAGIAPEGFEGTMQVGSSQDVTIPIAWEVRVNTERSRMIDGESWWLRLMGRLKPGATLE